MEDDDVDNNIDYSHKPKQSYRHAYPRQQHAL